MTRVSALARDWILRIRDPQQHTGWITVKGLTTLQPIFTSIEQDDSDIDSDGHTSATITGLSWRIETTGKHRTNNDTNDPGQKLLRHKGRTVGLDNLIDFQIYRRDDLPDAWQGHGPVQWADVAATDPTALQAFTCRIGGNGAPVDIVKPVDGASMLFPFMFPMTLS